MTCAGREEKKIREENEDVETQNRLIKEIKLHKYVGESARTAFDRGLEHFTALKNLSEESPLVEHSLAAHEG